MRRLTPFLLVLGLAVAMQAHVSPNVSLVRRGDFVKESLPGASKFFEKSLGPAAVAQIRDATGRAPSVEDSRVYVGRDDSGRLVGSVVFLWVPSQHGPICLGVAFDPEGTLRRATVTDLGTELLVWIRPLLKEGRIPGVEGLALSAVPDPLRIGTGVSGSMGRYYAKVIAEGVAAAQAIEKVSGEVERR